MFINAQQVPEGQVIETDLCVVGAGPAGITIARTLAGGPLDVCVLESGGPEEEPESQALGACVGNGEMVP